MAKTKPIPELAAYLKAISGGPLLAYTVHIATMENVAGIAPVDGRDAKWKALVKAVGRPEADRLVSEWINKPYQLE